MIQYPSIIRWSNDIYIYEVGSRIKLKTQTLMRLFSQSITTVPIKLLLDYIHWKILFDSSTVFYFCCFHFVLLNLTDVDTYWFMFYFFSFRYISLEWWLKFHLISSCQSCGSLFSWRCWTMKDNKILLQKSSWEFQDHFLCFGKCKCFLFELLWNINTYILLSMRSDLFEFHIFFHFPPTNHM